MGDRVARSAVLAVSGVPSVTRGRAARPALFLAAVLALGACNGGRRDGSALLAQDTHHTAMDRDSNGGGAPTADDAVGTVRRAADALAQPGRSAAQVLDALGARDRRPAFTRVDFTLAGAPFTKGSLDLDRQASNGADPAHWPAEAVTLAADTAAPPVRLAAFEPVFGRWRETPATPDGGEPWVVRFESAYRGQGAVRGARALTVTAGLSGDPNLATSRVLRVTLFHDE